MIQRSLKETSQEKNHDSMESLAGRGKSLCLQIQFGRAAKILSSDGVACDKKKTLKELMNLHRAEEEPPSETDDYSSTLSSIQLGVAFKCGAESTVLFSTLAYYQRTRQ